MSTRAREKIMGITITDVNPPTYSNLGDPLSISGTGFQDPLNSITTVNVRCEDSGQIVTRTRPEILILSDSLMMISGPSKAELNTTLPGTGGTSDVTLGVLYDSLDDLGRVVASGQSAITPAGGSLLQVTCKWLPGVQSITFPNILWQNTSESGNVTLNENAAPSSAPSAVQVPLVAVSNTSQQDVTVNVTSVIIAGQVQSSPTGFSVTALQSAVPGDTFTIVSTPDPSLDPYGYYATATAVIGKPPIYLDLPRSFTDGTLVPGVVYVQNPIAGASVSLAVDPPSANPGIPPNPAGSGGEYTFPFTPSVPTTVTFNVIVTYGALQHTFGPFICLKSIIHVPPPPPPGPGPI
jgi:hypothetical protein